MTDKFSVVPRWAKTLIVDDIFALVTFGYDNDAEKEYISVTIQCDEAQQKISIDGFPNGAFSQEKFDTLGEDMVRLCIDQAEKFSLTPTRATP